MRLTRRQIRILFAASAWTLYVWISRVGILMGQDESAGFKVVHFVLAAISIAFAVAIARIALEAKRSARSQDRGREDSPVR